MLDDYRRTFPYKLIGPIIDTEQLPTGDQLDQRRSLFPRCPARNNWCSLPPPPLCFPKKWKQKIVVDRKREGGRGAERDRERVRERRKKIEERRKEDENTRRFEQERWREGDEEGEEKGDTKKKEASRYRYRNIAGTDLDRRKTHARWIDQQPTVRPPPTVHFFHRPIISITPELVNLTRFHALPNPPPHQVRRERALT